ncbi:unnamed protein product [Ectocarpus sp. 6 AP-2014]
MPPLSQDSRRSPGSGTDRQQQNLSRNKLNTSYKKQSGTHTRQCVPPPCKTSQTVRGNNPANPTPADIRTALLYTSAGKLNRRGRVGHSQSIPTPSPHLGMKK